VISAFHGAAHDEAAPVLGKASFHVTVLQNGGVEISVGSASGEVDKWQAVAKKAAADLKRAPARIPSSRAGARLVIDVVIEETYPNGARVKDLNGPQLEATPLRLRSTQEAKDKLAEENPTAGRDSAPLPPIALDLPGVYLTQRGKVCGYRLGVTVTGPVFQGGCALTNIGAKPQRMVRVKARDEAMF
jgi:hypothetical protein